jgi:hypothetical protein
VILQAAMAGAVHHFFSNTGPTGQRAMTAMEARLSEMAAAEIPADVVAASIAYGQAVAQHIIDWSATDGGAVVINMGFPLEYPAADDPADWVPTSPIRQQQMPLLPDWGQNRSFAMPDGEACRLPPPPAYSEAPDSAFYAEAIEVYDVTRVLTEEQKLIARFWSDDPMLSSTPPGHWIDIALGALESEAAPIDRQVDVMGGYTAAAGSAFIHSANLPPRLQGKALVTEPTMKLIGLMDVRPDGAGYVAHDGFNLADHAQAHGHVVVDACAQLLDHAGAGHQLVADHFGVGRGFFEGGNEELGGFHRGGLTLQGDQGNIQEQAPVRRA